jgi:hypothetical protein
MKLTLTPKKWPRRNDGEMASYPYYIYQYILTLSTGLLIQYSTIQYNTIHTNSQRGEELYAFPPHPRGASLSNVL